MLFELLRQLILFDVVHVFERRDEADPMEVELLRLDPMVQCCVQHGRVVEAVPDEELTIFLVAFDGVRQ